MLLYVILILPSAAIIWSWSSWLRRKHDVPKRWVVYVSWLALIIPLLSCTGMAGGMFQGFQAVASADPANKQHALASAIELAMWSGGAGTLSLALLMVPLAVETGLTWGSEQTVEDR